MEAGITPVLIDIETVDFSQDTNLEHVVANFQKIAAFTCNNGGVPFINGDLACHGRILNRGGGLITKMLTNITGTTEGAYTILRYLFWKDGPFRKLLEIKTKEPWMVYHRKGMPLAIRIPDEVMAYESYPLVYSFLVCTRIPSEFKQQTKAFMKLVNGGVEPNAALLLSRRLNIDDEEKITVGTNTWNGVHTHINEDYNGFDWDMYRKGDHYMIPHNSNTGQLWARKSPYKINTRQFDLNVYGEKTSSMFTSLTLIPEDRLPMIGKEFEKFMNERYMK